MENFKEAELKERKELISGLFDKNIMVEAGAGAGKTSILTDRILNQIKEGYAKIEEIVAITFTNKATAEMKERLQKKLLERFNKEDDEVVKMRYKDALDNIYKMDISTIHSFCRKIIEYRPFDCGLGNYIEITEEDDFNKKLERMEKFFQYQKSEKLQDFALNVDATLLAIKLFNDIARNENMDFPFYELEETVNFKSVYEDKISIFEEFKLKNENHLKRFQNENFEEILKANEGETLIDKFYFLLQKYKEEPYLFKKELKDFLKIYKKKETFYKKIKKGISQEFYDGLLEIERELKDNLLHVKEKEDKLIYNEILRYLKEFYSFYTEKNFKFGKGVSNSFLLIYALKAVEKESTRKFIKDKYKCFYIDEFQDTDIIQSRLFLILASENLGDLGKTSLDDLILEKGRLFIVGDPKQSIYRFTGAGIYIYEKVKSIFEKDENSRVVNLSITYRLNENLGDEISNVFGIYESENDIQGQFGFDTKARYKIPFKRIQTNKGKRTSEESIAGIYRFDDESKVKLRELWKEEITVPDFSDEKALAFLIKYLVSRCKIYDENLKENRDIRFKDILVITKNKEETLAVTRELRENKIEVKSTEEEKYFENKTCYKFYRLLKYLKKPSDISEFVAVTDTIWSFSAKEYEIILDFIKENEEFNLDDLRKKFVSYNENYEKVFKSLKIYLGFAEEKKDISTLSEYFYNDLDNLFPDFANEDKFYIERELVMLRSLIEKIRENNAKTLSEIISVIEEIKNKSVRVNANILYKNSDFVNVMNLHKAKGLEGEIVILYVKAKSKNKPKERRNYFDYENNKGYLVIKDNYKHLKFGFIQKDLIEIEERENFEENIRLDYVAATRAKEALIFIKNSKDEFYDYMNVLRKFNKVGSINFEKEVEEKEIQKECYTFKNFLPLILNSKVYCKPLYVKTTGSKSGFQEDNFDERKTFKREKRPKGNRFGTLVHRIFETLTKGYLDNSIILDDFDYENHIKNLIFENISNDGFDLTFCENFGFEKEYDKMSLRKSGEIAEKIFERWSEYFKENVQSVFKNEILPVIRGKKKVYSELQVGIFDENEKVMTKGVMDLVTLNDSGEWEIFDYKTDMMSSNFKSVDEFKIYLEEKYKEQLNTYENILRKILKINEKSEIKKKIISLY